MRPHAELRVSLPRVGAQPLLPHGGGRKSSGGGASGWVVPLPAALVLLAVLAVVFQYQLLQCITEADRLDGELQQCQFQLNQASDEMGRLRAANADLQATVTALRREMTPAQLAAAAHNGDAASAGSVTAWATTATPTWHARSRGGRGDEAQEDPWDEETGALKRPPPADGPPGVQLLPLPPSSLAAAADAAAAAARANSPVVAHVVILACDRADYLARTLASVARVHNGDVRFPLHVSQDGTNTAVADVARAAAATTGVRYMQHEQEAHPVMEHPKDNPAYYRISAHYRWALEQLFDVEQAPRVILLEDDMELAPDFFEFFAAMAALMDSDDSLWCASSWNDNGQARFVSNERALARSDFFPGLGWMLTASTWAELAPRWPLGFWDDWMRLGATRRGRQCVRPEVCRTYNFGQHGASKGQFYAQYLRDIRLAADFVPWTQRNLTHLHARPYAAALAAAVGGARVAASARDPLLQAGGEDKGNGGDVVLAYASQREFDAAAAALGIFREWKDGVPRAAYAGVVTVRLHGGATRVFLAPAEYLAAAQKQHRRGKKAVPKRRGAKKLEAAAEESSAGSTKLRRARAGDAADDAG